MRSTLAERRSPATPLTDFSLQWMRRLRISSQLAYGVAGLVVLVALWSLGARLLESSVPLAASLAPWPTFQSLHGLIVTGELNGHTLMSLQRVLVGLGLRSEER